MVELSIILNTGRDDYPMIGLPQTFIFEPTILSLNKQELQNFELVIVDGCWSERRAKWTLAHATFPLKHLNALPNRFLENGMIAISSMKNKGIINAEGELVVFVDDCTQFEPWWTKRLWSWYEKGYWPMSMTRYLRGGEAIAVHDSRAQLVGSGTRLAFPSMFYGGSSATLDALLRVNGLDERFDGKKSLEDVDLGERLSVAGALGVFMLDSEFYHYENAHGDISREVFRVNVPVCNYGLLLESKIEHEFKANTRLLRREDCERIRSRVCPVCPIYQRCQLETLKGKFFLESDGYELWLKLQTTVDLRGERLE